MALIAPPDLRFGSDYSSFRPDGTSGQTYNRVYGPRVVLEGVARRWLTPRGDLLWAPNAGFSVAVLLNASRTMNGLNLYKSFLRGEALQVDFVRDATVALLYVGTDLTISGQVTLTTGGTYPLLVAANAAGAVIAQFPNL